MRCEKCKKKITGEFGSGRFCSQSCANRRKLSDETKRKIGKSLSGRTREYQPMSQETKDKMIKTRRKNNPDKYDRSKKKVVVKGDVLDISLHDLDVYKSSHRTFEICKKPCTSGRQLAIDHDHSTMRFRGLLCLKCNMNFDWFVQNNTGIVEYLNKVRE